MSKLPEHHLEALMNAYRFYDVPLDTDDEAMMRSRIYQSEVARLALNDLSAAGTDLLQPVVERVAAWLARFKREVR